MSKLLAFQHHQNQEVTVLCSESLSGPGLSMYVAKSLRNCTQHATSSAELSSFDGVGRCAHVSDR